MTPEEYRANPCGTLSIPYWKAKHVQIPEHMRIVHHRDYEKTAHPAYQDTPYFRLQHDLTKIPNIQAAGIAILSVGSEDIPQLVDVINRCYEDLTVTEAQLQGYTQTEAYCPALWIAAVDTSTAQMVGCGIADLDRELEEGILEWIQVLPGYRGRKIGQQMVCTLLQRMRPIARFATVSGKCRDSVPEALYRKCGFQGNDIWHILRK